MGLDELNRNIPVRLGFDNFDRSYSSAVNWARGKLGCTPSNLYHLCITVIYFSELQ